MDLNQVKQAMTEWEAAGLVRAVIVAVSDKTSPGRAAEVKFTKQKRAARAAQALALGLLITTLCAFIPIAHFVLVPAGILATLLVSSSRLNQMHKILGGIAKCPACGAEFALISGASRWPLTDHCDACSRSVIVSLKD